MKIQTKINILLITIVIIVAVFSTLKDNEKSRQLYDKYPLLRHNTLIRGLVTFKFDYKSNGLRVNDMQSLLKIGDSNYCFFAKSIDTVDRYDINEIVATGDVFEKRQDSDTIYISKSNGEKYTFIRIDNY